VTPIARRSSSDSGSVSKIGVSRNTFKTVSISHQMKELLDTSLLWDFDIFRLEELSMKRYDLIVFVALKDYKASFIFYVS
jgi:hypothetical protein